MNAEYSGLVLPFTFGFYAEFRTLNWPRRGLAERLAPHVVFAGIQYQAAKMQAKVKQTRVLFDLDLIFLVISSFVLCLTMYIVILFGSFAVYYIRSTIYSLPFLLGWKRRCCLFSCGFLRYTPLKRYEQYLYPLAVNAE